MHYLNLWNKFKDKFTEYISRRQWNKTDYIIYTDELFNITLIYIEDTLLSMGRKLLVTYGLPYPNRNSFYPLTNEFIRETSYNINSCFRVLCCQQYTTRLLEWTRSECSSLQRRDARHSRGGRCTSGYTVRDQPWRAIISCSRHRVHLTVSPSLAYINDIARTTLGLQSKYPVRPLTLCTNRHTSAINLTPPHRLKIRTPKIVQRY